MNNSEHLFLCGEAALDTQAGWTRCIDVPTAAVERTCNGGPSSGEHLHHHSYCGGSVNDHHHGDNDDYDLVISLTTMNRIPKLVLDNDLL